ncbi:unnamed protein product [Enterobius vermicularis]|uniref:Secreted protein n=1 Tax=Enterobius vermicularis TaxID=51028 RepID=A0A0N4VP37_ENTVE|nr:unnamed protein product [Enterobius vermicularis]
MLNRQFLVVVARRLASSAPAPVVEDSSGVNQRPDVEESVSLLDSKLNSPSKTVQGNPDLRETLKMLNGGNGSKKRRSQSETSEAEYVPLAFSVGSHKGDADSRSLYSN